MRLRNVFIAALIAAPFACSDKAEEVAEALSEDESENPAY